MSSGAKYLPAADMAILRVMWPDIPTVGWYECFTPFVITIFSLENSSFPEKPVLSTFLKVSVQYLTFQELTSVIDNSDRCVPMQY